MLLTSYLVVVREALLNRLLGIDPAAVLNPSGRAAYGMAEPAALLEALRPAIDSLKSAAYDLQTGSLPYSGLRQSREYAEFRAAYSARLACLDLAALRTPQERLAFWINLYNILVSDAIIAFAIRRSVREGRLGVLAFFRRAAYNVGGLRFSCEDIEHGILRANCGPPALPGPQFAASDPRLAYSLTRLDPRIHFALNCGARSCPPIRLYDASRIDAQLELATRSFVASDVAIDPARRRVHLSRLFRWYAGDFGGRAGSIAMLLRYLPDDERREWLAAHASSARLVYRPYDWALSL